MFATASVLLQAIFQSPRLIESSGVAVSRVYPDVEAVYVSPGDTAVYLINKGATRGSAIRVYRVDRRAWRTPLVTAGAIRTYTETTRPLS
jgi:hypothetical protein